MKNINQYKISPVIIICLPLKQALTKMTSLRQAQFLRTMAPPAPPQKITLLEEEPWSHGFFSNFHMKNVGLWKNDVEGMVFFWCFCMFFFKWLCNGGLVEFCNQPGVVERENWDVQSGAWKTMPTEGVVWCSVVVLIFLWFKNNRSTHHIKLTLNSTHLNTS